MTIEEAIAHAREVALEQSSIATELSLAGTDSSKCIKCKQEHEQLAEWLELLKAYREIGTVEECRNSILEIPKAYNKGIDDFARGLDYLLVKYAIENTLEPNIENVKFSLNYIKKITSRIIEQLKAGITND